MITMNYLAVPGRTGSLYLAAFICKRLPQSLGMAGQRLAALILWIGWASRKLSARSVFGCKPHYQTTALCATL